MLDPGLAVVSSLLMSATISADPAALAAKAKKQNEEIEGTPPHHAIRHPDMRNFWERCLKCNEVPWDTFWLHFPTGLAPEVFVDSTFSSHKERRAFQKAVHVVGSPEHVTVAMIDVAFPPGCPIGESATRSGCCQRPKLLVRLGYKSFQEQLTSLQASQGSGCEEQHIACT